MGDAAMALGAPMRPVRLGPSSVRIEKRPGGTIDVRPTHDIGPYPRRLTDCLDHWAQAAPDRVFLADRIADGEWRTIAYRDARRLARACAQAFIDRGLSAERPILVLSGNDIEHALIALAAQYAGVPYAPVSPAYSLVSRDFAKLKHIVELLQPGLAYVADAAPFEAAIEAAIKPEIELVTRVESSHATSVSVADLLHTQERPSLTAEHRKIGPDTIAKFLFTSGSTGWPKAVINTQRMLCSNQEMLRTTLAFLADAPPILVDWLPWNHTAGGNHNTGIALYNGGTLYIDDGNPTPHGVEKTVRNLKEIAPTLYFNVPKGYDALVEHLSRDRQLCVTFFSRVEMIQYAGAGMSQHTWDALTELAVRTCGERIFQTTGYGSTETAPFSFTSTLPVDRPGIVGLPVPGNVAKLVPAEGKLEVRVKGPNVTPGYWRQPDATAAAFDEEGYYRMGDALRFVDESNPQLGFKFDGRISEDFKLSTGTWVNVGGMRAAVIAECAPYVRDVVICGLNKDFVGALIFPDLSACGSLAPGLNDASVDKVVAHPGVRAFFSEKLRKLAARSTGSSTRLARAILLAEPPSMDRSEMTDKGSINQRAVLQNRAALVDLLYAEPLSDAVLATENPS